MQANVLSYAAPILQKRAMNALAQQRHRQSPEYNALATFDGPTKAAANSLATGWDGVDPRLVAYFQRLKEIAPAFGISETLRDAERQRYLVAQGKSQTLKSKHLDGRAVDIHLLNPDGTANWDFDEYQAFWSQYGEPLAREMSLPIVWGGNWDTLKDGVHFQIDS